MPSPHQEPIRRAPPPERAADPTRPRDVDLPDAANLLKIVFWFVPACFVMLSFLWYFCYDRGWISAAVFGLLVLLNFPIAAVGAVAMHAAVKGASSALIRTISSAGDMPPLRTYPRQEAMIARGEYAEAAAHFRDHLVIEPDDHEARLRLAALLEAQLGDPDAAEVLYKEVRARGRTPHEQFAAANGLIDLYRRTAQRGRLVVELARFVERYRGSVASEAARRELLDLKRDGPAAD